MADNDTLANYVDRLARLMGERATLSDDIKEVADAAKGDGFNRKAVVALAKQRLETSEQRAARVELADELARMEAALGEYRDTPLGSAALERVAA